MNKDLEQRYRSVIENNENVGKISDGKEFLILTAGFAFMCVLIFSLVNVFVSLYVDNMSDMARENIETMLGSLYPGCDNYGLSGVDEIKRKIIRADRNSKIREDLPVCRYDMDEVNAFVVPNGKIYLTKGFLNEVKDEEMIAFVLAHEIGHYVHKDHLKSSGRQITAFVIMSALSSNQSNVNKMFSSILNVSSLSYSRKQEKAADMYANKMILSIYGRNTGAVRVLKLLEEKSDIPEFTDYFSSHPKTKDRIKLLNQG